MVLQKSQQLAAEASGDDRPEITGYSIDEGKSQSNLQQVGGQRWYIDVIMCGSGVLVNGGKFDNCVRYGCSSKVSDSSSY